MRSSCPDVAQVVTVECLTVMSSWQWTDHRYMYVYSQPWKTLNFCSMLPSAYELTVTNDRKSHSMYRVMILIMMDHEVWPEELHERKMFCSIRKSQSQPDIQWYLFLAWGDDSLMGFDSVNPLSLDYWHPQCLSKNPSRGRKSIIV